MKTTFIKQSLGWGFLLWLIGYLLGIVLFFVVPPELLGWVITPIGIVITLWVLFKRIKAAELGYYLGLGAVWTILAVILDYLFLVQLLKPQDGYYKFDVYLYYFLTLALPVAVGWYKSRSKNKEGLAI